MCAILGFMTRHPNKRNVEKLRGLYDTLDVRGRDATGIAIYRPWKKDEKKKFLIAKKAIPTDKWLKECFPKFEEDIARSPLVIGHIRAQTQGTPKDPHNNHPVTSKTYLLTHNGSVNTTPRIKNYPYKGEVDTEIIVSYLEEKGFDGLKDIKGSAGIAFADFSISPPKLYLWAHNQTFYLGMADKGDEFWWSSTDTGVFKVCEPVKFFFTNMKVAKFPENELFKLEFAKGGLAFKNLGEYRGQNATYTYSRNTNTGRNWQRKSADIISIPTHMMEDVEEGAELLYVWSTKESRYVLDAEFCEENKVRPYLDEDALEDLEYNDGYWPTEACRFDQHNWRVFNAAVGVQSVALAKFTILDLSEEE
jgi:hypothetical protein